MVRDSEQEAENGAEITCQRADGRRSENEGQHPAIEIGDFRAVDFFQVNIDAAGAGIQDPQLAKREASGHAEHRSDHPGSQRPGGVTRCGHDRRRFHERSCTQHHADHDGKSADQANVFFECRRPARLKIRHPFLLRFCGPTPAAPAQQHAVIVPGPAATITASGHPCPGSSGQSCRSADQARGCVPRPVPRNRFPGRLR